MKNMCIGLVLAMAGVAFATPVLYNAGFEVPDTATYTWEPDLAAQGGQGWDFSNGGFHAGVVQENYAVHAAFGAAEGEQMGSMWDGGDEIAQTMSGFVIGETYTISWSERAKLTYTGNLSVLMDSVTIDAAHAVSDASWAERSVEFVATATSHRLRFLHTGTGYAMTHIDKVEITEGVVLPNLLSNGSFEQIFTDGYGGTYNGVANTRAYVGNGNTDGQYLPGWSNNPTWGYVWNPTGSGGVNHFGTYVGLTNVWDGNGACGSWGSAAHVLDIWQHTGAQAQEGDTVRLIFYSNALSADYGSQAWLDARIRFAGGGDVLLDYVNTPQDVWTPQTVEAVVSANQAGKDIQVYLKSAGVWVDNVHLEIDPRMPGLAWSPSPANGEELYSDTVTSTTLGWKAGDAAVQHDVYLGTSSNDVANGTGGTFQGRQAGLSFDPGMLDTSTTYYWRVDEIDVGSGVVTGEVWSFAIGAETRDLYADTWVATDALDRSLPNITDCGASRTGRVPGMFYFIWQGGHNTPGPHDVTQILAANPSNPPWVDGHGLWYWWGKPEADYFVAEDEWMIRRNISMLTDAGIKVLYLDATNAFDYRPAYMKLFEVLHAMKFEGYDTSLKIVFFTHSFSPTTVTRIYDEFYQLGTYSELWYMMDGKPLILGYPDGDSYNSQEGPVSTEVRDFFTWRSCWYVNHGGADSAEWSWESHYPQGYSYDGNAARPEQMAITPTGARGPMSREGRSYSSVTGQPAHNQTHLPVTGTEGDGLHFTEQIGRALEYDPEHLFITGWNEWVGGRWEHTEGDGLPNVLHLGEPVPYGGYYFVDQYNQEYSRDIDPMEGGHTDNYYFQMIDGIRRYTGVRLPPAAGGASTIAIDGSFGDWEYVTPEFRDTIGDTFHRSHDGWGSAGPHINNTGRNDFLDMKVARDDTYVYFYAKTRDVMTSYTDPDWMLLFINSDQNHATGWEGYDFVLNRSPSSSSLTTLEQTSSGWNWSATSSAIEYTVTGNEIEIRVPRSLIGQGAGDDPVAFDFHWADNIQADDDIIQFGINGDSAPNRRFDYRYQTRTMVETTLVSDGFESGVETNYWGDWDITAIVPYTGAHSLECSVNDPGGLTVDVPTPGQESFRVSFKYRLQNVSDARVWYHDGTDWVFIDQIGDAEKDVWLQFTDVRYNSGDDARFFNVPIAFHVQAGAYMSGAHQYVWIDDVEITGYSEAIAAVGPNPPDGATGVSVTTDLGWSAGAGALSHDVYLGTSSPGSFQGNQSGSETFTPGSLQYGTTYYWHIDEQTAGGTVPGPVWSFTTEPAPPPAEIYAVWAAGFGLNTNTTGALAFDYEPDGLDNLTEYALGGNPTNDDAAAVLPAFDIRDAGSSNVFDYVYRRRLDAAVRGLTYGLNVSTNLLAEWMYVSNAYETGSADIDPGFESVTNEVPFTTDEGFIKLEIGENF